MKKSIGKKTVLLTHPVLIIGSYDPGGKPNIMAASWAGICCSEPPCVTVSLRKQRHSYNSVMLNKAFTINIPSEKYIREADFTGIFSGKDVDKFKECGLTPVHSGTVNAPYIMEFNLNMICRLVQTVELGIHTMFIGEILDTLVDEDMTDIKGNPLISNIKPFIYDPASRAYYSIGDKLMDAYTAKRKT